MSRARKANGSSGAASSSAGELVAAATSPTPDAPPPLPPVTTNGTNGTNGHATHGHASNGAAHASPATPPRTTVSPFAIFSGLGRASAQRKQAPPPPPPGPTGLPSQQDVGAAYRERFAAHMGQRFDPKKAAIPQGETKLVHAWLQILLSGIPAHAVTIWIDCTDQPAYSLDPIQGEWVAGDHPDRELWTYVRTNRKNPTRPENFVGRIRGPNTAGVLDDLATGTMSLPAMPAAAPGQAAQGAPAQPGGWPGYGGAPPNAWGVTPGGGWAAPPGGGPGSWGYPAPPWWWGHGQPHAPPQQTPPRELADNPALLEIWRAVTGTMQSQGQGQNELIKTLIERALTQPAQLAAAPPRDPLKEFLQYFELIERIRPPSAPAAAERGGMTIHRLEGGTTLVEKADGSLDTNASALISLLPDAKKAVAGFSAGGALKSLFGPKGSASASAGTKPKPSTPQGGAT